MASESTVAVVGLGYVGLPVAVAFDDCDHQVLGYDVDESHVTALRDGRDPTDEIGPDVVSSSSVQFTADPTILGDAEYIIVTVPTPMKDRRVPNLDYVESAGRTIGRHMAPRSTVVLESTVYPGATRHRLIPALETTSGLQAGDDFGVGYSPERINPGTGGRSLDEVVKIVSALTDSTLADLVGLYDRIVDAGVHRAPTLEVAETAKCIENIQRDLNIALMNELAMACDSLNIDTDAVLDAAGTKWNFHDYKPGLVGGHCIPVDPFFFIYQSEQNGFTPELVKKGREVNEYVPKHVAQKTIQALNACGKVLRDSRVLVLGLAYKPNTGDLRTSTIGDVIDSLREYDIDIVGYDPLADTASIQEEFDIPGLSKLEFEGYDGLLVGTGHDVLLDIDFESACKRMNDRPAIVDTTGELRGLAETDGVQYAKL